MDKSDVEKFLQQNIKCPKTRAILADIQNKYGYPYMVGALCGPPKTQLNNLYQKLIYNNDEVTQNSNHDENEQLIFLLTGAKLYSNTCYIQLFWIAFDNSKVFYNNKRDSLFNFYIKENTISYPENIIQNLNLKFFYIDYTTHFNRKEYNKGGVIFGYNDDNNSCEFINFTNYFIQNKENEKQNIFPKTINRNFNGVRYLDMCIHAHADKGKVTFNLCIYDADGDDIKILDEQYDIIHKMPELSLEQILTSYYICWNLNANIDRDLTENDRLVIEYAPIKNKFLTGLKPFLSKCKCI